MKLRGYIIIIAATLLHSCYTDSKATKQLNKAIEKKPAIAAEITRQAFPCITVGADTSITYSDSTVWFDAPAADRVDTLYKVIFDSEGKAVTDTVFKPVFLPGKPVKIPVQVKAKTIEVVKRVEDSAKIKLMALQLQGKDKKIAEQDGKISAREKAIKWLLILLVLSLLTNYIQFKNRK